MSKWEEKMYRVDSEYSEGLPFFDIVFKTVSYSIVYTWYNKGSLKTEPEFKYLWLKSRNYHPQHGNWVRIVPSQVPKRVRERFEEIKPLFYLMR
jgi:lipocalin